MTWPLLAFLIFLGLLALGMGWFIHTAQKSLDKLFEEDDKAMREALKNWPP